MTTISDTRDAWALTEREAAAEHYRCDPAAVTPAMLDAYRDMARDEARAAVAAERDEAARQGAWERALPEPGAVDWTGEREPF